MHQYTVFQTSPNFTQGDNDGLQIRKTKPTTYSSVALLKNLMSQEFQGATVDSRLGRQVALDGVIGFTTVGWTGMENHLPLDGTGIRVPDKKTTRSSMWILAKGTLSASL